MLSTLSSLTEETAVHHKHLQTHVQVLFITFLEPRVFKAGFTCLWPPHSFQQPPDHLAIVFFWHQWTFTCFRPTHARARSTPLLSSPPLSPASQLAASSAASSSCLRDQTHRLHSHHGAVGKPPRSQTLSDPLTAHRRDASCVK